MTYQIEFIIPSFQNINTYQVDRAESAMLQSQTAGFHMSVTFEMIRLIIWQVLCSAKLQGFHVSMTLSNCVLKVANLCHHSDMVTWSGCDTTPCFSPHIMKQGHMAQTTPDHHLTLLAVKNNTRWSRYKTTNVTK